MKGSVEAGECRADIETGPGGVLHVALSAKGRHLTGVTLTPDPPAASKWIVIGTRRRDGEPVALVWVSDIDGVAVQYDSQWPGMWREIVTADSGVEAAQLAEDRTGQAPEASGRAWPVSA